MCARDKPLQGGGGSTDSRGEQYGFFHDSMCKFSHPGVLSLRVLLDVGAGVIFYLITSSIPGRQTNIL